MSFLLLVLMPLIVLFYGIGQVFSKEATDELGPPKMGLVMVLGFSLVWGIWWLLFHEPLAFGNLEIIYPFIAGALDSLAFVSYYEALEKTKVSLSGTIIAAYPALTLVLGFLFLGEYFKPTQIIGMIIIIGAIAILSYSKVDDDKPINPIGAFFIVLSFLGWGMWSYFSKLSAIALGYVNALGLELLAYPLIMLSYWILKRDSKLNFNKKGFQIALISVILFAFGSAIYTLLLSIEYLSITSVLMGTYPSVTIVYARFKLNECLRKHQYIALFFVILGIVLLGFG